MQPGSDMWWDVVQTAPFVEAETMLRDYKVGLLKANAGTYGYTSAAAEINRINAEIHRLQQVKNRSGMRQAILNVCGAEVYAQVLEEMARLEWMEQH